jgi:hypothetical protein
MMVCDSVSACSHAAGGGTAAACYMRTHCNCTSHLEHNFEARATISMQAQQHSEAQLW